MVRPAYEIDLQLADRIIPTRDFAFSLEFVPRINTRDQQVSLLRVWKLGTYSLFANQSGFSHEAYELNLSYTIINHQHFLPKLGRETKHMKYEPVDYIKIERLY